MTDCNVWRSLTRLWTDAWARHHPATQMLCAPTCISRVCFHTDPATHRIIPGRCPVDHLSSLLPAEKRAGVFHIQATSGPYGLTFSEATEACEEQGAVLASLPQLSAAQQVPRARVGAKPMEAH